MAGFQVGGVDLDTLFEPIGSTAKRADVGYTIAGSDISNFYADATLGTPYGTTNFNSNSIDVGTLFAAAGSVSTVALFLYAWGRGDSIGGAPSITYSWTQVSAGNQHTAAIRSDGALFTWGTGTSGRLGNNSTILRSSPVQIGTSSWTSVNAGRFHTSAIRIDGGLFTWGRNDAGQTAQTTEVFSWTQVSAGSGHTAAIRSDGLLFTWGYGLVGQLGIGDGATSIINRSSPVQVGTSSWTSVSAGREYTVAIRSDGGLFTWGSGFAGRLGLGDGATSTINRSSPVQVGTSSWTSVRSGRDHAVAIRSDGGLFTWGSGDFGRLGLGDGATSTINRSSPVQVGTSSWTSVSAGGYHTAAIRSDGALFVWGVGSGGRLGIGVGTTATINRSSPVQVGTSSWTSVSAGGYHTAAIRLDSGLFTWGVGSSGRLGLGDGATSTINRSSPVQVGTSSWTSVSAGFYHSFAIRDDGTLFTWGSGTSGRLGLGDTLNRSIPTQVGTDSWTSGSVSISGNQHTTVIRSDGVLFTWGLGSSGRLGLDDTILRSSPVQIGNQVINRSSPVQVGTSSWTSVSGGNLHTAAIRSDGGLFVWGRGSGGRLGLGASTFDRSIPVQVGTSSWTSVASGYSYTAAIRSDGGLFTWGDGSFGQTANSYEIYSWTQISAGSLHTAAIRSDGLLFTWGFGNNGRLGLGDTLNQSSPVQVGTSSWTSVSAGSANTAAIRSDGGLFIWGFGPLGILGLDSSTIDRSSPVQIGTSSWTSVSLGTNHSSAIRSDGGLFTWGLNSSGQLALDNFIHRSSPVQVGTSSWTSVSAGASHTSAIRSDGGLFTWGAGAGGRLGLGSTGVITETFSWTQVSVGDSVHAAAIRSDGLLFTWGLGSFGRLGLGNTLNQSSPVQVGTSSWTSVSTGSANTAAIRSDGGLFIWGSGANGRLGLDSSTIDRSSPVQIGTSSWTSVSAGDQHVAAIRSDGGLFTWGQGSSGRLGIGVGTTGTINRSSPVQVGTSSWTSVSAGRDHTAAIRSDGGLFTWGPGEFGRLGLAGGTTATINRSSPVQIGTSSWTSVSAGGLHTAAILNDGRLFTWGAGVPGRLGLGFGATSIINRSSPTQVGTSSWTSVNAGDNHCAAIRSDGILFTWGSSSEGQLGINSTVNRSSPVQVGTVAPSSWTSVNAGQLNTAAIRVDGILFSWGGAGSGQVGNNDTINRSSPIQIGGQNVNLNSPVQVGTSSWTSVSSGGQHTVAIRSDSGLFTWGVGSSGRLGLGDGATSTINRSSPVQIGTSSWTSVSAGFYHSSAIRSDGGLFTWGLGSSGRLGLNNTIDRSSPVQVGTSSWTSVSAGDQHVAAIRSDGGLFTWGAAGYGRLGIQSFVDRSNPVQIGGEPASSNSPVQIGTSSWTIVSAGLQHAAAIRSDGGLFTWGQGFRGRLGLGSSTIDRSSPVQVGTSSWVSVSAGNYNTTAIRIDYGLFTWGENFSGQLGTENIISRSSPVQVGTSSWTSVSAYGTHVAAIKSDNGLFTWGLGSGGQLGLDYATTASTANRSSPVQVGGQTPSNSDPVQIGTNSWASVSAGGSHTAAIRSDKKLFVWGSGQLGRLGLDSSTIARSIPVQVGTSSWTSVSAGRDHTAAIRSDGGLFTWGAGAGGRLGLAGGTTSTINRSSPVQVGTSSWTSVSAGRYTTAAIRKDAGLFTWGYGFSGQLGIGDGATSTINRSSPVQVGTSSWTSVSVGGTHTAAIRSDGILFTWGLGTFGQTAQTTEIFSWTQVSTGRQFTAAIRSDGILFAWGLGTSGQLGNGTALSRSSPVQVGISSWTSVSTGDRHVAAIRSDGGLFTWGYASSGRLGLGDSVSRSNPSQVGTDSWISVSAGGTHTAAIRSDGALFVWGGGQYGRLGTNDTIIRSSPTQVGTDSWTSVSAGYRHTAAIRNDGALFTFGLGSSGRLGLDASTIDRSSPVQVGTSSWTSVSTGNAHTIAIRSDGALFTWGLGSSGRLGIGDGATSTINRSSPTQVGTSSWTSVSAGREHNIAVRLDGSLFAWGAGSSGRLGLGIGATSIVDRSSPVQVGTSSWTVVNTGYAGASHTAAIRNDSTLFIWGPGVGGGLGVDSTIVDRSSPVQVGNQNITRSTPGQVGTSSWTSVSAGIAFTNAIRSDGGLFIWGNNFTGRLGLDDTIDRSSPVQIGASSWTSVSSGSYHSAAIRSDGGLFTWGTNNFGQLALGDFIDRSSPVQVGTRSWTSVSAGRYVTAGLTQN